MCDLVLENALVFNAYFKKFIKGDIYIKDDKIFYIDYFNKPQNAKKKIDLKQKHVSPGFIDIHMHIESSMLTPPPFCNFLATRGITTIVAEPHEIANVFGIKGIKQMLDSSKNTPIDVFFGIPSSVPSTSSELEGTGAKIGIDEMIELLNEKSAICVGEIMNYRQIIKDDNNLEVSKFLAYLKEHKPDFIIEGHCPKLIDEDLAKFLYLGINADHTEHDFVELKQRYMMGMFVELQGKMLKEEYFDFIKENDLYVHTAFVTDDVMADTLYHKGHLDYVLKQAIQKGFGVENTIYCATYTPSVRMNLKDRGVLAPGKKADLVIFDDVNELKINSVYKNGVLVDSKDDTFVFDSSFYHSINTKDITKDDFVLNKRNFNLPKECTKVSTKLLKVCDGTTQIKGEDIILDIKNDVIDKKDYMLGVCFNRYGTNDKAYAIFGGDTIKKGAIATTWSHDHHNLFVVGENEEDMVLAANTLKECGGGMVAVYNGKVLALLELGIAGILSDDSVENTAKKLEKVRDAFKELGYKHYNEIMSFGTYGLACSPFFKLTDKGLVDVTNSKIIPTFEAIND